MWKRVCANSTPATSMRYALPGQGCAVSVWRCGSPRCFRSTSCSPRRGRGRWGGRCGGGAHAVLEGATLTLNGAVVAPDGSASLRGRKVGPSTEAAQMGRELADELLARGAGTMLPVEGGPR